MPPSSFIKAHRAVGSSRILAPFAGIDRPVLLVNTDQNMVCTCYLLSTIYYLLSFDWHFEACLLLNPTDRLEPLLSAWWLLCTTYNRTSPRILLGRGYTAPRAPSSECRRFELEVDVSNIARSGQQSASA